MSLGLNMLCRLVVAFLIRSKWFLTSWLQSASAVVLEPPKIKSATVSIEKLMINTELMALPILWPTDAESQLIEQDLMLRKIEGKRRMGQQRMKWLHGITDSMAVSLSKLWDILKDREAWIIVVHAAAKRWTRLNEWTTTTRTYVLIPSHSLSSWHFMCSAHLP